MIIKYINISLIVIKSKREKQLLVNPVLDTSFHPAGGKGKEGSLTHPGPGVGPER